VKVAQPRLAADSGFAAPGMYALPAVFLIFVTSLARPAAAAEACPLGSHSVSIQLTREG